MELIDLYFEHDYGRLYESMENGVCEIFEFTHELGKIRHMYIKREIPIKLGNKVFYDIVTPYGYGGPVITNGSADDEEALVEKFEQAFQEHCRDQNIVSEFIRFHPVLNNAKNFKNCYEVVYSRNTVGTNIERFEDPVKQEFSKSARKNIRQALGSGVEYRLTRNPENLEAFKEIYYVTMKRNNADSYYYFNDEYFKRLLESFGPHILLSEAIYEGKVIGMGLNFIYKNMIHTHLSGTLAEYHKFSPAYVLQFAIASWGKEHGFVLIHDGGGRSDSPEDKLYMFKKQFGKHTKFDFYTGRKIWDAEVYKALCTAVGVSEDEIFFPAYRAKKQEFQTDGENMIATS